MTGVMALSVLPTSAADLDVGGKPVNTPALRDDDVFGGRTGTGLYVSARAGASFLDGTTIDFVNDALLSRDINLDQVGWVVTGAIGWRFTPRFRGEIEIGERVNDVSSIKPGIGGDGSVSATSLIVNGYLDLPRLALGSATPYVGAGFGKAWLSHDLRVDGGTLTKSSDTTIPWAYQLIGGLSLPVAPQWDLNLEYRYLATQRALFGDASGQFYHSDYHDQSVLLGVSWHK
jgi:opacity protein-like surface antigen